MFVIPASCCGPIGEAERRLAAHRAFRDRRYADVTPVCPGPRTPPRTCEAIVCRAAGSVRRRFVRH